MHSWSKAPTVVTPDVLCLPENFGQLYLVANCAWQARQFHFETSVRDRQGLFAGRRKVELFSMQIFDRAKYHCEVSRGGRITKQLFIVGSTPLSLAYYSWFVIHGSVDDHKRV